MLDLIIIGGSAAGNAAAIYAARRKLNFKMVATELGGEVALSGVVNNWPGIIEIQGFELAQKFTEHVRSYGVEIDEGWRVEKIEAKDNYYIVSAKNASDKINTYETKTVIIATGIHPRHLKVPGEEELNRKGVTYCTVCDGPLFKNKVTATIGSGNSALESALMMAGIATKVYLISKYTDTPENKGGFPKGETILVDKVKSLPNIEVIYGATTTKINGTDRVVSLDYTDNHGATNTIEVQGVMVHIGQIPNSNFDAGLEKNTGGEIIVDAKCKTNLPGVFAAGDVTNIPYKQIGISAGQGIISALAAIEHINKWK